MIFKPNSSQFFDAMYRENADPWKFATNPYELQRYLTIYNALSHQRYKNVFEPGCSVGVLTEKLAEISDSVQAFDISAEACMTANKRCAHLSNVTIQRKRLEYSFPAKQTNLIILSEIGYYFTEEKLHYIIQNLLAKCKLPLTILASHWLGKSEDHILSGDRVQQIIGTQANLILEHHERNAGFRLDRWRRNNVT